MATVCCLAGDGIGPEVMAVARAVLGDLGVTVTEADVGGVALERHGTPLPDETVAACRRSDAVLLAAVGGPRFDGRPDGQRPEQGLLGLRRALDTFANLRPARPLAGTTSPLRDEVLAGTDLLVVRELTAGIYFGRSGESPDGAAAFDTCTYRVDEVERVAEVAFAAARDRRGRVTSVDKANVMATSRLWRRTVTAVAERYRDVALDHLLVDNAAMQLCTRPASFDVILTENLFGDVLSDEAAALVGGLGVLPSASLGAPGTPGLFEPVHGSAPDIAGTGTANPTAILLSVAMLLEHGLGRPGDARRLHAAVADTISSGPDGRTRDLGGTASTVAMGDAVRERLAVT